MGAMTMEEAARHILKQWGDKTLATLRDGARKEFNGTSFDSLRVAGHSRFALFVCVTGEHELAKLQPHLEPPLELTIADWSKVSYVDAFRMAHLAGGLAYAVQGESDNLISGAVAMISSQPRSSSKLERLLGLEP
jgi:hypothetical protein